MIFLSMLSLFLCLNCACIKILIFEIFKHTLENRIFENLRFYITLKDNPVTIQTFDFQVLTTIL